MTSASSGATSNACLYSSSALSALFSVFQEKHAYSQSNLESRGLDRTANSKYFSALPFSIHISFKNSANSLGKCVFLPMSKPPLLLPWNTAVRDAKTSGVSSCANHPSRKATGSKASSKMGRHPRLLHSTLPTAATDSKEPCKAAPAVSRPRGTAFSTSTSTTASTTRARNMFCGNRFTDGCPARFARLREGLTVQYLASSLSVEDGHDNSAFEPSLGEKNICAAGVQTSRNNELPKAMTSNKISPQPFEDDLLFLTKNSSIQYYHTP